jgi:TonB-linked SusC/RagA family outer membrane protein
MRNKNKHLTRIAMILSFCLFSLLAIAQEQSKTVNGIVTNFGGEAVSGANIEVESSKFVTTTDKDGKFTVKAKIGDVINIKHIAYKSEQIKIQNNSEQKIILIEESTKLDEIVVVGYGTRKKKDLTSSIASIKAEDLVATSVSSIDQGLQGRASGVVVLNTSGQPGGATSIRIRGTSSINGNNEPLYVIDGVPVMSDAASINTGVLKNPAFNPMSNINPNDISSIEILKDAAATSIYGARGANGVVLVTTKRGKSGAPKVTFNTSLTVQSVSKTIDMLDAVQLAELGNEAADNDNIERKDIYAPLNNLKKQGSTNWQDELFRDAIMQRYDIGISGGGEKSTYFISSNLFKQEGIIIGSDFNRGTLRINFDQKINDKLKVGVSSNLNYSKSNGVVTNSEGGFASSVTSWALEMNPALPVKDADGNYTYENNTATPNVGNPVQDALEAQNKNTTFRLLANAFLEYKPIRNLQLRSSIGIDYFNTKDQSFASGEIKRGESTNGYANIGNRDGNTWVFENTANYDLNLDKHSLNFLAGITTQAYTSEFSAMATADFDDPTLGFNSIQSGALKQLTTSGASGWQMMSYLARANYAYDNRYLLMLTARVDGSSKFGKGNKYGTFPSAALAWKAKEEDFLKDNNTISNLKLRASYGIVGNEGIAPYSSQGLLFNTEAYFGNNEIAKGLTPYTLSNNDLKWETTGQFDAGFDLGFFDDRLSITSDVYLKKTDNLLLNVPTTLHSGYDLVMQNVGNMENKGFDLSINAVPLRGKFSWNSDFTFGYNQNEVTNLAGSNDNLAGASVLGITYWTKITKGKAIGTLYGYKTDGIAQLDEDTSQIPYFAGKTLTPGKRKYIDKNGDGTLNEDDLYELGNANPDYSLGFSNTFNYQFSDASKLSLTLYLQGSIGNEIANFNTFALESFDGNKNNSTAALKRWTPTNPTNDYPMATTQSDGNIFSDHYVEDGSYLRVKDITLGYDFAPDLLKACKMEGLGVYFSLRNIYTFTNYSGFDPEVSRFANNNLSMGADYGSYPMSKMIELGLKANF